MPNTWRAWKTSSISTLQRRIRSARAAQIETAFIDPGKPWQNDTDESFSGKLRDQHLLLQWFRNRTDAKVSIEGRDRRDQR